MCVYIYMCVCRKIEPAQMLHFFQSHLTVLFFIFYRPTLYKKLPFCDLSVGHKKFFIFMAYFFSYFFKSRI